MAANCTLATPPQPSLEPEGCQRSNSVWSVSAASSSWQPPYVTVVPSWFWASLDRPDDVPAQMLSLEDTSTKLVPLTRHGMAVAQPGRTVQDRLRTSMQIECPDETNLRSLHVVRTQSRKQGAAPRLWQTVTKIGMQLAKTVYVAPRVPIGRDNSTSTAGAVANARQPLMRHSAHVTPSFRLSAVTLVRALNCQAQAVMEHLRLQAEHRGLLQAEHVARSLAAVFWILEYRIQHAQTCILSSPVGFVHVHKDRGLGFLHACYSILVAVGAMHPVLLCIFYDAELLCSASACWSQCRVPCMTMARYLCRLKNSTRGTRGSTLRKNSAGTCV
jgi:hypothetical protein